MDHHIELIFIRFAQLDQINIILYRNALKRFDNITQLRQVPLMNEEIYRKIAPYLVVD